MTTEEYEKRPYHLGSLLWAARIFGSLLAVFLLYIAIQEFVEEVQNHSPSPLITMIGGQYLLFFTLTFVFLGLVLAYWKEGWGGGISLVSAIVLFIGWHDFHVIFILGIFFLALPSMLYVLYWWLVFRYQRAHRAGE